MNIRLTLTEKEKLETHHKRERDGRVRDRIKAVLLSSEGWSIVQISQALRKNESTIIRHLDEYHKKEKLHPENKGTQSRLSAEQTQKLIAYIESSPCQHVKDICAYVKKQWGENYSIQGMTNWLHRHEFVYKKPTVLPKKADLEAQKAFIEDYNQLVDNTPDDEPILFADGVHPTMQTKVSYGWIRKGAHKFVHSSGSRTRLNMFGAIELKSMQVTIREYKTINGDAIVDYLQCLRDVYPNAPKIHLIVDRGPYNRSAQVTEEAKKLGIILHYLPSYSPNLNPSERLWKVMNTHTRNNVYFEKPADFKEAIRTFFTDTWEDIKEASRGWVNDNFHLISVE